jgi:energy-coupling factor transporter ATP-binding protein EcfA2
VAPHTDAPDSFITWSAISLIGAAMKNNVWFKYGTFTLYPNLYIILVAPPGIGKGTAMNLVTSLVEETAPQPVVNALMYRNTTESILIDIEQGWNPGIQLAGNQLVVGKMDHTCLFVSTEIRTLLGASDWMLEFLEEAWSETKYKNKTKNKGVVDIKDMCFSMLAGSVPDFLRNINKEIRSGMVITGGFSSRCIFVYSENPSKDIPWPEYFKDNAKAKAIWNDLVTDIKQIAQLSGMFQINPEARIIMEDFLKANRIAASVGDETEVVANARARIKANTLKLAMVFSASRSDSLIVNGLDMRNATAEMNKMLITLDKLFRGAGDSADAPTTARVQAFIEKVGMTTTREIMRSLHRHIGSFETLDRVLTVLEAIGFCQRSSQPGGKVVIKHTPPQPATMFNGRKP